MVIFFMIVAAVVVIIIAVVSHNKHQEEQREMEIKAEQLRREAARKRAEEERKRKEEEEKRVREEARRAEEAQNEAQKNIFKNSKCVQEFVVKAKDEFVKLIQEADRGESVTNIEVFLCIVVDYDSFHFARCPIEEKGRTYFKSYGLRNLNYGEQFLMREAINDLLIPKLQHAIPHGNDRNAQIKVYSGDEYGGIDNSIYNEYTYSAQNGNYPLNDW